MLRWKFLTYVSPSGRNEVQSEVDRYDDHDQQALARAVAHLAVQTLDKWHEPQAKKLKAKGDLYEVRYRARGCATRALGYFGPVAGHFTITLLCTHKQNVYQPHDAFATAARRAQQVEAGTASVAALQIDGEDFPPDDGAA